MSPSTTLVLVFFASAALAWLINYWALSPWRNSTQLNWAERAARLFPARAGAIANLTLIPVSALSIVFFTVPNVSVPGTLIASLAGVHLGTFYLDQQVFPRLRFFGWLKLILASWALRSVIFVPILIAAYKMPTEFILRTWLIALAIVIFYLGTQYNGLTIELMRLLGLLRPAPPKLRMIVEEMSARMNVPVRAVWLRVDLASNAMAFVLTREVAFTQTLLETCTDEEIQAVAAHELSHLCEGQRMNTLRVLGSLAFVPYLFIRPALATYGAVSFVAMFYLSFLIRLLVRRLARRQEVTADQVALDRSVDKLVYAQALERIYRVNWMPAVLSKNKRATHPDLYDRMLAVGVPPDFPRPEPPRRNTWPRWTTIGLFTASILGGAFLSDDPFMAVQAAVEPNGAEAWRMRGEASQEKNDFAGAIGAFSKAIEIDPKNAAYYSLRGSALESSGEVSAAIADYTTAIEIDPASAEYRADRGAAEGTAGDFAHALTDYDSSIALDSDEPESFEGRANVKAARAEYPEALEDYDTAIAMEKSDAQYSLFGRYFVELRLGKDAHLSEFAKTVAGWDEGWPKTVGSYLCGSISESAFLVDAQKGDPKTVREHQCEAFYYAGMTHLLAKEPGAARALFSKSIATKESDFTEYALAQAELSRLSTRM